MKKMDESSYVPLEDVFRIACFSFFLLGSMMLWMVLSS